MPLGEVPFPPARALALPLLPASSNHKVGRKLMIFFFSGLPFFWVSKLSDSAQGVMGSRGGIKKGLPFWHQKESRLGLAIMCNFTIR